MTGRELIILILEQGMEEWEVSINRTSQIHLTADEDNHGFINTDSGIFEEVK